MKLKVLILYSLVFLLPTATQAEELLQLSHRIVGVNHLNKEIQLHIEFSITNTGDKELNNLLFCAEGIEFTGQPIDNSFKIKQLPVNGSTTLTWIGRSYLAEHYFSHETPLFFLLEADLDDGSRVQVPIISSNGEVL